MRSTIYSVLVLALTAVVVGTPRPVVMWHGLGDSYQSNGMVRMASIIRDMYPDIFIHSVYLDEDPEKDSKASLFGKLDEQVAQVCEQLAGIEELKDGFDALGFSQGGLFMRAYVERCNVPRVHKLITFGSPQNGVADFPPCDSKKDLVCRRRNALLKTQAYTKYTQDTLTVAQYYRDTKQYTKYLEMSGFLADINNERQSKNAQYKENLSSLDLFVMFEFSEDTTVVPKESAWFGELDLSSKLLPGIKPLARQPMYIEDWIGLRSLDTQNKLAFRTLEGRHMLIKNETVVDVAEKYLGTEVVSEQEEQVAQQQLEQVSEQQAQTKHSLGMLSQEYALRLGVFV
ncbi:Alpha/Beta hydrolase protein [Limtongia smithiae]|uniref:Alpha/Beta hydrolase protein n=1 Tax=Limtongia smithiae TaxID=1125753 RepID=UPI0034CEC35D